MTVRVLVVIGSLEVGGAEMDLLRNLPAIDRSRFHIEVYTFDQRGALADDMEAAGIPVFLPSTSPIPLKVKADGKGLFQRKKRLIREFLEPRKHYASIVAVKRVLWKTLGELSRLHFYARKVIPIARFIRKGRFDIVHCILPNAYFYGSIAALMTGRPILMSRLSLNFYQDNMPFYKVVERKFLHRFVKIAVGNAKSVLDDLIEEGIPKGKLFLLYNGIALERFTPSPQKRADARRNLSVSDDALVFTAVGNLHPYKGHADLIKALAIIKGELPKDWALFIAGSDRGGHIHTLVSLIEQHGLRNNVHLLGHVDDVSSLLAASDLHIMPSHEEGLPNSIIEAMAAGLPVIGSAVGGIPELIETEENGTLVPPRDVDGFSKAILAYVKDKNRRKAVGAHNLVHVTTRYSLARSVADYEELYTRAIAKS